jgi:hypothetical protein
LGACLGLWVIEFYFVLRILLVVTFADDGCEGIPECLLV